MNRSFRILLTALAVIFASQASTNTVNGAILADYRAFDYTGGNHGLWTSSSVGLFGPGGTRYWSIEHAKLTVFDDDSAAMDTTGAMDGIADYAKLQGTVRNQNGVDTAVLDLTFSGFIGSDYAANSIAPKNGGGGNPSDWDFYTDVDGTIAFSFGNQQVAVNAMVSNPDRALQIGFGANDKNGEFGGSSWVSSDVGLPVNANGYSPNHWDLNLKLTETPEPSAIASWSMMGIIGLALVYVRRRSAARHS